jgi:PhnB protein
MKVNRPPDYHTVTPRMVVSDAAGAVEFLRAVFDAVGEVQAGRPAEARIGDSLVMVTSADERELFPAFLYVYVDDADRVYGRALKAGAISLEAPRDTPYGDRRAMVGTRTATSSRSRTARRPPRVKPGSPAVRLRPSPPVPARPSPGSR